jgi:hypothetical protein
MSQTLQRRPYVSRTTSFTSGADSPVQALEECLAEIAQREPAVGAFTVIEAQAARATAEASTKRWRANTPLSAIDGMPVGVKDMIDTADMVTGMGSPLFDGYRPRFDAASVQGLRDAGAVILGKTVTTEFASAHPRGTRNPWDLTRTPGGSSSGSAAAVGCGMLCGGLGTQVVGSSGTGGLRGARRTGRCGDQRHRAGGRAGWLGDHRQSGLCGARLDVGGTGCQFAAAERRRTAARAAGTGLPARRCVDVRDRGLDRGSAARAGVRRQRHLTPPFERPQPRRCI